MVADLVRDYISVGEVAAAAIFGLHVTEERHVEIDRLVYGAIERPHRRLRAAATGIGRAVVEHQFRVDVSHALLRGQHFLPDRLGLAEHVANEARHAILGAAGRLDRAWRRRVGAGVGAIAGEDLRAAEQHRRVDAGEIADHEDDDDDADAEAAGPAADRHAAAATLSATVLDIGGFGRVFPFHGCFP